MNKYHSKYCKYYLIATLIGAILIIGGVSVHFFSKCNLFDLKLILFAFGGNMILISLPIFFAERSRWLKITDGEILLPKGVNTIEKDEKSTFCLKRVSLEIKDIVSVKKELVQGDRIIVADTFYYSFKTKNGKIYKLPLYSYGEKNVKEIMWELRRRGVSLLFETDANHRRFER